ncbi:Putative L-lactate dehydrogenase operon regulatory protein [Defluviimonas aquaemixtae]|uniref:L-lactate dehydrogenase operon regulatory protein n=1 Tax=Albidovulum aquaemixtae TaxID=1542388 RepID=A0A2R8B684_9RHOB|nr:FCD domain-containing protein [Defluviimonas aquaemixtae]SPH18161.1 Putative L-lactate dehydrogenase operon regulatory protein [Defluviimonas aquaemixtae]
MARMGSADIAALMRREIAKGTYQRHDRLPASRKLAELYGVARNTLRDALGQLEAEGFLETRPGSGTYITFQRDEVSAEAVANASPLELIDARFALEPHVCRLCVLHGRREDFDRLDELCTRMEASVDDPVAFAEADSEFHRTLAETTRNALLIWIIRQINRVRSMDEWTRMRHLTLDPSIIATYNLQHRQILNAIRSREPERATAHMKEHLETARLSLTRAADT